MSKLIVVTDPNKDIDDLLNLILMGSLKNEKLLDLAGIIVTHGITDTIKKRALYTKGVCNELGLDVPVCVGDEKAEFTDKEKVSHNLFQMDGVTKTLMDKANNAILTNAQKFLKETFEKAKPHSLNLLIIAQMTDIANFINASPNLFLEKINNVSIQGGIDLEKFKDGVYLPDDSANNKDDMISAEIVYGFLAENKVKTNIMNRLDVYKINFSKSFYDALKNTGHILGTHTYDSLRNIFVKLIINCFDGNSLGRQTPTWFLNTFTGVQSEEQNAIIANYNTLKEPQEKLMAAKNIFEKMSKFCLYDPLTLVASQEQYSEYFLDKPLGNFIYKEPVNKEAIYKIFKDNTIDFLRQREDEKEYGKNSR
ncbi:MAG: nucleoside hydrolase [Spirochaetales bacterium]